MLWKEGEEQKFQFQFCKMAARIEYVKHRKGKLLRSGEKQIVLNVFSKFCEKYPTLSIQDKVNLKAEFTGVYSPSINSARSEVINKRHLSTPGKTCKHKKPVTEVQCDEFVRSAVHRKVQHFFEMNEPPTINKAITFINSDPDLSNFKKTSLHNILREIRFEFVQRNRQNIIVDCEDILLWHRKYLRKIREYRRELYFLDEIWVDKGHAVSKV